MEPDSSAYKAYKLTRVELRTVQAAVRERADSAVRGRISTPKRAVYKPTAETDGWTAKVRLNSSRGGDILELGPFGTELEAQASSVSLAGWEACGRVAVCPCFCNCLMPSAAVWLQEAFDTAQVHLCVAQIRKRAVFNGASYVNKLLADVHPVVEAQLRQSPIAEHRGNPVVPFDNRWEALQFLRSTWQRLQEAGLLPDASGFTGENMGWGYLRAIW